ncbi:MAG TPA: HlyD family efflux transporter periplasmic adaptor subunit [Bryobacteraceae bacterium]|jgi:multidrug efflux pump subunit AcrA (membrane-fusion protein)|nr:HlyD family efflux transporter periplasmic adaptor subunit [Bryobacteraceae bacterium]
MIKYGLPIFAALALTFAVLKIVHSQPVHAKLTPPAAPPSAVYANQVGAVGLVEAESENIAISLPVPGLVTRVDIKAGDHVRKGARLFSLDDRDLQAELALRQSSLALAETKLEKLTMSPRPEDLPPAEARVREAEQLYQDAAVQLNLIESVRDKRAIRDEDLQRRRLAVKAAEARLDGAKGELALLKAGTWKPDLDIARAEVAEARRQMERVEADLTRLVVTAPLDGEILQSKVHAGEYAQAGTLPQPLILMGATRRLNVRADIDEQDAWRVKAGATAIGTVRGNTGERLPLDFVRVEPYVIPKRNLTGDSTERVDTRVLQVIFALHPGVRVYAGQQLDVFIDAGGQK